MSDNDAYTSQRKETSNQKRKAVIALKVKVPEGPRTLKSNVMENGAKLDWRFSFSHGEGPSTALSTTMQERFATLPGNMANAISKAFSQLRPTLRYPLTRKLKRKIDCYIVRNYGLCHFRGF